jgi:hypothetical protein
VSRCRHVGCEEAATNYLKVTVAPYGYPIERGMAMAFGLQLCLAHAKSTKASDLFDDEGKKRLREITRVVQRSEVPLDFTRTKIEIRTIGDDEWQLLQRAGDKE